MIPTVEAYGAVKAGNGMFVVQGLWITAQAVVKLSLWKAQVQEVPAPVRCQGLLSQDLVQYHTSKKPSTS